MPPALCPCPHARHDLQTYLLSMNSAAWPMPERCSSDTRGSEITLSICVFLSFVDAPAPCPSLHAHQTTQKQRIHRHPPKLKIHRHPMYTVKNPKPLRDGPAECAERLNKLAYPRSTLLATYPRSTFAGSIVSEHQWYRRPQPAKWTQGMSSGSVGARTLALRAPAKVNGTVWTSRSPAKVDLG